MTIFIHRDVPFELYEINILNTSEEELPKISLELGVGLNLSEMDKVKHYFLSEGRNPTDIEIQTIGQTWSEHCFHRTFKGKIKTESGEIKSLFNSYILKVTKELNNDWCFSVFEDNAGIVDFEDNYSIAAKVETHNHPSAIEPFGGAATGVGGVIRDILGVWADPIACTDVLGFGPLNYSYTKLPRGVKHPKYIFRGVVAGIGCYGNNMGIPTVNGAIYFDESYTGNVIVYCGCVGLLPKKCFIRNAKHGDVILLVGGRTGRDGIHGVTFASSELTIDSEEISRSAVQIANPIEEEKVKRAIITVRDQNLASGITDLGGGGLSSAVGEMAKRFKCGAFLELDKVPSKEKGLAPWEIYISESQERMLLLVPTRNLDAVINIFKNEDVEATPIGRLTKDNILKINYLGFEVANLDIDFLFSPPAIQRISTWKEKNIQEPKLLEPENLKKVIINLLSSPNICSRENIIRTYDHEVKGKTVLKPLHGALSGPNDASVLKPLEKSWKGVVISCGMNPQYGKIDPYWMAASAIEEAIRNNIAVGGRRIALLDNFVWGSPEKPDRLGELIRACKACYRFAKAFKTPFISGKDSLYNESPLGSVTPTLLITALGLIPDIRQSISLDLKSPGNYLYILGQTYAELGGSEYYRMNGFLGKSVPIIREKIATNTIDVLVNAIDNGCVRACHDLSEGGLAVSAIEMAISSNYGLEINLNRVPASKDAQRNDFILFSESNSRFLIEVPKEKVELFKLLTKKIPCEPIGKVLNEPKLTIYGLSNETLIEDNLVELRNVWKKCLEVIA